MRSPAQSASVQLVRKVKSPLDEIVAAVQCCVVGLEAYLLTTDTAKAMSGLVPSRAYIMLHESVLQAVHVHSHRVSHRLGDHGSCN